MWEAFTSSTRGRLACGIAIALLPVFAEMAQSSLSAPTPLAAGLLFSSVAALVMAGVMMLLPPVQFASATEDLRS
ncbi:MAG: hypothetical protein KatS3mg008_2002 [Acidimicrobiales bacterium]|nr:MAG: hypothetical protein KatS3mg008_2002 [Acidimicrobiales bacterium]